jgi:hypothetical protein
MDPVRTTLSQVFTSILQYILTWLRMARTGPIKMYWFFYHRVFKRNGLLWSFRNGEFEDVRIDAPLEFNSVVAYLTHTRRSSENLKASHFLDDDLLYIALSQWKLIASRFGISHDAIYSRKIHQNATVSYIHKIFDWKSISY